MAILIPFLCFHFRTFCRFSNFFFFFGKLFCLVLFCFFLSLQHGIGHCQKQEAGLSVDNQLISVFGVNVVHLWKDTVLV